MTASDRTGAVPVLAGLLVSLGMATLVADHLWFPQAAPGRVHAPWIAVVVGVGFLLSEAFVVNLDIGEVARSFTLHDIPMVIGLAFVAPKSLIIARVASSLVVLAWTDRKLTIKLLFNGALAVAQVGVCLFAFHEIGSRGQGTAGMWLSAMGAVLVMDALGSVAVSAAINLAGHGPDRTLDRVRVGAGTSVAVGSLGLLAVELATDHPAALWMLLPVVAVLHLAHRQYASLRTQHVGLQQLHEFTRVLASAPELMTTIRHSLQQARVIMRASRAEIYVLANEDAWNDIRITLSGEDDLITETVTDTAPDPLVTFVTRDGRTSALLARGTSHGVEREILDARDATDLATCALRNSGEVVGTISVYDHTNPIGTFAEDDLKVFETLANHVSASLEKARLIDELRSDAAEKEYEAQHDALTGLGNRTLYTRAADEALEVIRNEGGKLAVLLMDLNRFKDVNDTLGHHSGDQLLRQVADRLTLSLPPTATAIRLGGDEFVFLLPHISGAEAALEAAHDLLERLTRPFTIGPLEVGVGAAVGIAVGPQHGLDAGTLLQRADIAMYAAKSAGEGSAFLFDPSLTVSGTRRLSLGGELRTAIEQGALEVHYQPIAAMRTAQVVGVEALMRWRHPVHGWIPPDDIVALAEHLGLMRQLTQFVLESATRQARRWRDDGHDLTVAVNLAAQSLVDARLPDDIGAILRASGLPPAALVLEITETQVIRDPDQTLEVLERFRAAGVTIAVDDFGTGYSSLSYLSRLPVGEIKIDQSFVQQMLADPVSRKIVASIIDLGENLGLPVVAEGVEGLLVWDALDRMGCAMAQGYFLSRPANGAAITEWLETRRRRGLVGQTVGVASPPLT